MALADVIGIGASGLRAQVVKVATVADNTANARTPGHRKVAAETTSAPPGAGVATGLRHYISSAGTASATGSPTDMMVSGDGFFMVSDGKGNTLLTRSGNFAFDAQSGQLKNAAGYALMATPNGGGTPTPVQLTAEQASSLKVGADGTLASTDADGRSQALYRIPLATAANPDGMTPVAGDAFQPGSASGPARTFVSGQGPGTIRAGYLEDSNVDMATEMTDLVTSQASFMANFRTVRMGIEMLDVVLNMKR